MVPCSHINNNVDAAIACVWVRLYDAVIVVNVIIVHKFTFTELFVWIMEFQIAFVKS